MGSRITLYPAKASERLNRGNKPRLVLSGGKHDLAENLPCFCLGPLLNSWTNRSGAVIVAVKDN